jgi:hypothetical protein
VGEFLERKKGNLGLWKFSHTGLLLSVLFFQGIYNKNQRCQCMWALIVTSWISTVSLSNETAQSTSGETLSKTKLYIENKESKLLKAWEIRQM